MAVISSIFNFLFHSSLEALGAFLETFDSNFDWALGHRSVPPSSDSSCILRNRDAERVSPKPVVRESEAAGRLAAGIHSHLVAFYNAGRDLRHAIFGKLESVFFAV